MSFAPVFDKRARILIVGTYPSPASLETGFYYGHPANRFWRLMASVLESEIPCTVPQKKKLLLDHFIALWDVLDRCDITGAADATIRNGLPNHLPGLLDKSEITAVFANGAAAARLTDRYFKGRIAQPVYRLPSTSPANAAYSFERLFKEWVSIRRYLILY